MRGEVANMLENRLNGTLRQYELNSDIRRSWDIMHRDVSPLNYLYINDTTIQLNFYSLL